MTSRGIQDSYEIGSQARVDELVKKQEQGIHHITVLKPNLSNPRSEGKTDFRKT